MSSARPFVLCCKVAGRSAAAFERITLLSPRSLVHSPSVPARSSSSLPPLFPSRRIRRDAPGSIRWHATGHKEHADNANATSSVDDEDSAAGPLYSEEELRVGEAMLRRIVADLKDKGCGTFVIPWHDSECVDEILRPLRQISSAGVKSTFIISALVNEPALFALIARKGSVASAVMEVLVENLRMSYEDVMRFMAIYGSELVETGADGVQARIDRLAAAGIDGPILLQRVVRNCPAVLFAIDAESLGSACEAMGGFFTRKQIASIVQKCPSVLLQNVDEVEAKYEYMFYQMCLEGTDFLECRRWAEIPLDEIMARHDFLKKCGRYTNPDAKNPQLKMENPSLHEILDSTDEHFACDVAGVSNEEWILFQSLREKLASGPPSFERIKPSKRKAYERRQKEGRLREEHVFDSGMDKYDGNRAE